MASKPLSINKTYFLYCTYNYILLYFAWVYQRVQQFYNYHIGSYCILCGRIKGFNSSVATIMFEVGTYVVIELYLGGYTVYVSRFISEANIW